MTTADVTWSDNTVGPSGLASLPPEWLASRQLPIAEVEQGSRLYRVHQAIHGAVFYGPARDPQSGRLEAPKYRFDSQSSAFGVLYAARTFSGAFVESLLRQPEIETVSWAYRSCPTPWCRSCFPEWGWLYVQAANAGIPTKGASLNGAMVSSVM